MQLGRNEDQEKGLENKMDGQCRGLSPSPGGAGDTSDTMISISKRADNRGVQRKATHHEEREQYWRHGLVHTDRRGREEVLEGDAAIRTIP